MNVGISCEPHHLVRKHTSPYQTKGPTKQKLYSYVFTIEHAHLWYHISNAMWSLPVTLHSLSC